MNDTSRIDIVVVDLAKTLLRENYGTLLATGDEYANRFGATIVRHGEAVDITGYAVTGSFIRPDGVTLNLDGTAEGNTIYIDLTAPCYSQDGVFTLSIKIIKGDVTQTVRMVDGYLRRTDTGNFVATEETIITLDQMKGIANELVVTNKKAQAMMDDLEDAIPVRGVDYWTDEDKQSIVDEVLAAMPEGGLGENVTEETNTYTRLLSDLENAVEDLPDDVGFETDETLKMENGILSVNTADVVEEDNTLPVTSAAVFAEVGNINALLGAI